MHRVLGLLNKLSPQKKNKLKILRLRLHLPHSLSHYYVYPGKLSLSFGPTQITTKRAYYCEWKDRQAHSCQH